MAEFLTFATEELLMRVASLAAQEFTLVWGFEEELTKLRVSLNMLEAVLRDAEHPRQDHGQALKLWLEKLEQVAHLADHVLDDYGYELLRRKVELRNQIKRKVLNCFSPSNPIVFRVKMAHKIKKINTSLDELKKDASTIGLVAKSSSESTLSHERRIGRETYSDFKKDESNIIGRKKVVEDMVKALTNSNNNQRNDLSVLAIVGMGGLGKTTVAKSVYHDGKIQQHFQEKMWVCVSTPFEVNSILRGILESLKPEHAAVQAIDAICRILKTELKEKRYFLVLDDVWNEDKQSWEDLIGCLEKVSGTLGSSILVTTRRETVAKIVETLPRHNLDKLSDDECWLILKERALPVGSAPLIEDQEKIGREIAKKCGGVPLVAKVLGNMMRSKNCDGWRSIAENVMWDLLDEENRIFAILKLSFDELGSPALKQCFAYCSLFVKDFKFEKDDLIQHWMAQGWLHPSPNKKDREMEDTGNEYFNILLENSFFQDKETDFISNTITYKMHDLAIHVSKSNYWRSLFFNGSVLESNSPGFKALHVLNLYKADIQELPYSIGKLKHLRYLNVMKTRLRVFPKSLGQLYHLQTLKMPDNLIEFPMEIANLINLRHVYFGARAKVPAGVLERLNSLRSLSFVKIGKETGPQITELRDLNHLRGTLSIRNLEHVRDGEEAVKANLVEKEFVRKVVLKWEDSRPSNSADSDQVVLEALRPHSDLEILEIHAFRGVKLPSWLSQSNNLKEIELVGCIKCEEVPLLGRLPNLVRVKMEGMEKLRGLGYEFYGYDNLSDDRKVLFPALKELEIEQASNLTEWKEVPTERVTVFPCLEELTLWNCDQLQSAPSHFPSLKRLEIDGMNSGGIPIASILSSSLTTLTSLVVWNVRGLACLPESLLENNQNLEYLGISSCPELTGIVTPQSRCSASLRFLEISGCPKLRCIPDNGLLHPLSLKNLDIYHCSSLESIPIPEQGGLPSLEKLVISNCAELSSLPDGLQHCTSLRGLEIRSCPKIKSIPIPSGGLPSLAHLLLWECAELSSLPSGLGGCTSLEDLSVTECPKVTSVRIDILSTTLRGLTVSNLESLPNLHGGFTSLRRLGIKGCQSTGIDLQIPVSLEELKIRDCPNLETVPSLDKLTSLRTLQIRNCSRLTCLPSGFAFTRLKELKIGPFCHELDSFPTLQVLPQLESLLIYGWPKLKSLPEQIQHLTSLTFLWIFDFEGVEAIPEWFGNLASLENLYIERCESLKYLPSVQAMDNLTKLEGLSIHSCSLLKERCREESGPEWPKISHIPRISRVCLFVHMKNKSCLLV